MKNGTKEEDEMLSSVRKGKVSTREVLPSILENSKGMNLSQNPITPIGSILLYLLYIRSFTTDIPVYNFFFLIKGRTRIS